MDYENIEVESQDYDDKSKDKSPTKEDKIEPLEEVGGGYDWADEEEDDDLQTLEEYTEEVIKAPALDESHDDLRKNLSQAEEVKTEVTPETDSLEPAPYDEEYDGYLTVLEGEGAPVVEGDLDELLEVSDNIKQTQSESEDYSEVSSNDEDGQAYLEESVKEYKGSGEDISYDYADTMYKNSRSAKKEKKPKGNKKWGKKKDWKNNKEKKWDKDTRPREFKKPKGKRIIEIPKPEERALTLEEFEDLRDHAFNSARWSCERYARNTNQVKRKLVEKGYPEDGILYYVKNSTVMGISEFKLRLEEDFKEAGVGNDDFVAEDYLEKERKYAVEEFDLFAYVIDKLEEAKLIDDRAFCRSIIESTLRSGKSISFARNKMYQKDTPKDIMEDVLEEYSADTNDLALEKEQEAATKALKRVLRSTAYKKETDRFGRKNRIISAMGNRGFFGERVNDAIQSIEGLEDHLNGDDESWLI